MHDIYKVIMEPEVQVFTIGQALLSGMIVLGIDILHIILHFGVVLELDLKVMRFLTVSLYVVSRILQILIT